MIDPRMQALLDQLDTILLLIERPAVQRQFFAFGLIFFLSWLVPSPLGNMLTDLIDKQTALRQSRQARGLPANRWRSLFLRYARSIQLLVFPVVGLIASQLTIRYFVGQTWPAGLLQRLAALFWLILIYRFVAGLLLVTLPPETAKRYQKHFFRPIFIILIGVVATAGMAGAFPIFDITLFTLLETPLTLSTITTAVVVVYLAMTLSSVMEEVFTRVIIPRFEKDGSAVGNTIQIMARYTIIAIGVLIAFSIIGFNLSALAIIGGGLSVGIGFGLQELVANFISGILLLFEQTLRPGDIIEVGGQRGVVSQLRMRSTVLRTADNVEVFVPNKTLLTSTVSAHTLTDKVIRRTIHIGVSYKSDPVEVRDVLTSVVTSHGLVLKDPPPTVFFVGFGESSLNFDVCVWIGEPGRTLQIMSDLHFMIFRDFARNHIEMPFPQRDLHLRSADGLPLDRLWAKESDEHQHTNGKHDPAAEAQPEQPAANGADQSARVSAAVERPQLPG
jgi:small-conductance mechanosensitive channel